jgi:hypothetical protein
VARFLLPLAVLAAAVAPGCTPAPTYVEAHGSFGDGTPIAYHEDAVLYVGPDPATGATIALVKSTDPARPAFMGLAIQVDLDQITEPGRYECQKSGGPAQLRVIVPGAPPLDTVEYTAAGTLSILELPVAGNHRFAGSFANVRVDYDGQDLTLDEGAFRGQQ